MLASCKQYSPTSPAWLLAILVSCVLTSGCSDDGRPKVVPISGQVLIDGKPLTHGFIRIVPADARPASGEIGTDGRFTLKTFEDDDGAVTGVHLVAIMAVEYLSESDIRWHAPEEYSQHETSGLTVDIEGPTDSLIIELSWDGGKPYRTHNGVRVK